MDQSIVIHANVPKRVVLWTGLAIPISSSRVSRSQNLYDLLEIHAASRERVGG